MISEKLNATVKKPKVIDETELNDQENEASTEVVWRRFSEDDGSSEIDWDEATLSKLLDFDDDSDAGSTVVAAEVTESRQTPTANTNPNVITQSELFDDPHIGKTQPTLAGNPFAKFGTVGLGLGVVFVTAAFFLNTVMKGKSKVAPEMVKTTPKPEIVAVEKQEEAETGKLKAELALGKQAEQIKAVEAAKSPKPTKNESSSKTRSDRTFPTSKPTPTPQIRRAEPVVQYTTPQYPISPRFRVAQQSFPVRQRSVPTVENVALQTVRSAPRNSLPTMQSKQSSSVPQVDPFTKHMPEGLLEQWLAMSRLGSYGSGDTKLQTSFTTATPTRTQSPSALDVQPLPQEVISIAPKATPVVFASEGGTSAMTPQSPSTPPLLPDPNLEKNILTGIPVQQLRVGMTAIGKISIPMVWANPGTAQTKSGGRSQGEENFVVRLTQPIVNDQGYEVIPPGSEIVCIVQGVHKSGYAIVQATRLVVDKREYVLPNNAIAVTGKGGNPLMASRYGNKGGEIAKRDATAFVFGSLARVGKVLNEPDETSSFASVGIGGSTSTTSIKRRNPNLLGAVLEGGFTPLTEQILARNQAAMREIAEREDVWYVRAGTDVQVVVNQSFEL